MAILPYKNDNENDKQSYLDFIAKYIESQKSKISLYGFSIYLLIGLLILISSKLISIFNKYGLKLFDDIFIQETFLFFSLITILVFIIGFDKKSINNRLSSRRKDILMMLILVLFMVLFGLGIKI